MILPCTAYVGLMYSFYSSFVGVTSGTEMFDLSFCTGKDFNQTSGFTVQHNDKTLNINWCMVATWPVMLKVRVQATTQVVSV